MATTAETIRTNLYADLQKFGQISDYERTLKIANKILHSNHEDEKAFQFRIISLIQLSRFEDALLAFTKFPSFAKTLQFEKAYALYRINRIEEALEVLETVQDPDIKHNELKAQVYYRLERFEECFDLYRDVIKQTNDEFDEERQTNLAAIVVNLVLSGKPMEMPEFECDTFEIKYNFACYQMAKCMYAEAEKTLKISEKICRESFDEDTPVEEVDDEVSIIKLQQACCAHFQGHEKEALSIYTSMLKKKPSDLAVVAVASNNSIAINRGQNLFDSKKKMKNIMNDSVLPKLTRSQKQVIDMNHCLLNMYTNQGEQALAICDNLVKKHPGMEENAVLMKASIFARENRVPESINLLESHGKKNPSSKLKMKLAIVQLLLNDSKVLEAVKVLESLGDATFWPGIVSAIVTMYLEMGKPQDASKILEKAVSWNQKNKTTVGDLSALWRHAADLHLRNGQPEIAASSLEELLKINSNDVMTLAQLIIAYAQFDPTKANNMSNKLPHLVDLTPNIDADTLESTSWMMGMKVIKKAAKVDPSPGTPLVKKKKSHSKRKKHLPKNYNPNVTPDPERWLPKHERSTFRKKKDRRNKDVGKGTQGTAAGASDQYDMSKMANASKLAQNTPSPPQEGPRQQQRKIQQKKKKKSGKR
ncbi:signal recognition particle subunit SRP72 [Cimex lectularius]|uniref:Signal recognition particle subunit SRP72 n=1 Tax=Cimex lectularius TaxID=79782 RepID=A0A8I6RUL5_CIMLE|nr:signal recognition particle subunit SRP72 [Cimex lectularius]